MSEIDLFRKYTKPGDIVYDIGANVGNTVRDFLRLDAKYVYAFEPSPNNFGDLINNCQGFPVTCLKVALHEKEYTCDTPFKDCRTDYTDDTGKKMDSIQQITYCTLESVMKQQSLPAPDVIKLDVEGMESLVLNTFEFLWKGKRPIVYVEIHAQPRAMDNQNYADNPHFRYPEQGGFDFNLLKSFDYYVENSAGEAFSLTEDWNFSEGTHSMFILIPKTP